MGGWSRGRWRAFTFLIGMGAGAVTLALAAEGCARPVDLVGGGPTSRLPAAEDEPEQSTVGCLTPPCPLPSGSGDGTFQSGQDASPDTDSTESIVMGDLDGDGNVDLIELNDNAADKILLGAGDGTFGTPTPIDGNTDDTWHGALGDVDGDSVLDLLTVHDSSVGLYLGDGDGTFGDRTDLSTTSTPRRVALADLDQDGNLDVVIGFSSANESVFLLGNGDGTFADAANISANKVEARWLSLGDLFVDGHPDLIVPTTTFDKVYRWGSGINGFANEVQVSGDNLRSGPTALADLNGTGKLDLIMGTATDCPCTEQTARIYQGNGLGTFYAGANISATTFDARGIAVGDLDGDGDNDVIFSNDAENDLVFIGNGDLTFEAEQPVDAGDSNNGRDAVLADLDGDGILDLVVGNSGQSTRIYLGN